MCNQNRYDFYTLLREMKNMVLLVKGIYYLKYMCSTADVT